MLAIVSSRNFISIRFFAKVCSTRDNTN